MSGKALARDRLQQQELLFMFLHLQREPMLLLHLEDRNKERFLTRVVLCEHVFQPQHPDVSFTDLLSSYYFLVVRCKSSHKQLGLFLEDIYFGNKRSCLALGVSPVAVALLVCFFMTTCCCIPERLVRDSSSKGSCNVSQSCGVVWTPKRSHDFASRVVYSMLPNPHQVWVRLVLVNIYSIYYLLKFLSVSNVTRLLFILSPVSSPSLHRWMACSINLTVNKSQT